MEKIAYFLLARRRILLAVYAGLAAWSLVSALAQEPEYVLVPVAARDLPSAAKVSSADIEMARFLPEHAPKNQLARNDIPSMTVAGPMRRGEPFTDRRVIQPHGLGAGENLALIDVPASHARLLRVGDFVDVVNLTTESAEPDIIARTAEIASIEKSGTDAGSTVGVIVTAERAHAIMTGQLHAPLTVLPTQTP